MRAHLRALTHISKQTRTLSNAEAWPTWQTSRPGWSASIGWSAKC